MRKPAPALRSFSEVGPLLKLKHFILVSFLFFVFCFLFFAHPANAQSTGPYSAPVNNPDVQQNLHTYSQNIMIEAMAAMICQLSGVDPIQKDHTCLSIDPVSQKLGYAPKTQSGVAGGAIGSISNLIGYTFQIPASSGQYFNYLASNFGIVKKSYGKIIDESSTTTTVHPVSPGVNSNGQTGVATDNHTAITTTGTGFESLNPLLPIWVALRDLVYVLFVVGFIVVGVAIMLRIKIDPRTVMTLQNRIPKIIAALVLVTFSYAIAGFLIDFMWTAIYLVINLFASADPVKTTTIGKQTYSNLQILYGLQDGSNLHAANVFNYASSTIGLFGVAKDAAGGVSEVVKSMLDNNVGEAITLAIGGILGGGAGFAAGGALTKIISTIGPWGAAVGTLIGGLAGAGAAFAFKGQVAGIIVFLIILVAILSALFRLWFKLLTAFILIILGVILAPLWIFAGILPGNKLGFGSWIRHMLSQIIIFPMTIAMFSLGKVTVDAYKSVESTTQGFVPPLLGYGTNTASITSLIALGFILITPNVAKWAGEIFKGPKLDATPIGQALKAGTSSFTSGGKTIGSYFAKTPKMGDKAGGWGAIRQVFKF
jgi:hypothetical protein